MILVNVTCPQLRERFDFKVDETAHIYDVIQEMTAALGQQKRLTNVSSMDDFLLCRPETGQIFNAFMTLAECGVCQGDSLLLL